MGRRYLEGLRFHALLACASLTVGPWYLLISVDVCHLFVSNALTDRLSRYWVCARNTGFCARMLRRSVVSYRLVATQAQLSEARTSPCGRAVLDSKVLAENSLMRN